MRFLAIIRHNAERLARLTEDLLTLSRVEQKRQKFEFESHLVDGLLKDAMDLVRPIAEKSGDPAGGGIRARGHAEAWCDSEAVSQILEQPAGQRHQVHARRRADHGGARARPAGIVEVYVRDTGVGIPAEDLPRLFERFYRVDKARSRELGGTGLGLSIVKHLVAALDGTTRVESAVGQGSTFFFTLPADESAAGIDRLNPEFTTS